MGYALRLSWLALLLVASCGRETAAPDSPAELIEHLRRQFPAMAGRLRAELPPAPQQRPQQAPLKPAEARALAALAKRDAGWLDAHSPARADEPLRISWQGVTVEVRSLAAGDSTRQENDGITIYRNAYQDTDVLHVPGRQRHEELLYLRSEDAPTRFEYEVTVRGGSLRPTGEVANAHGEVCLRLARPFAADARGRVLLARLKVQDLRVVVELDLTGARYPVLVDPTWETGHLGMAQGRFDHSLSLLGDGRILACGGTVDEVTPLASCEVLNPAGGQWSFVAPMPTPRMGHTATTMSDGKVLACGGGTAACEEYDPWHDTWTPRPAMAAARTGHTSTLLHTGNVLIVGGDSGGVAEVYDPTTRTWTPAGSIQPRSRSTATRLGNGTVLVVGGIAGGVPVAAVDLYDPGSNAWNAGPVLSGPRAEHTATRTRNAQVLVVGGTSDGSTPLVSAVLYDEATSSWTPVTPLADARRRHVAGLAPWGEVVVAGGHGPAGVIGSTEAYTELGRWQRCAALMLARERAAALVTASGDFAIVGGRGPWSPLGAWERFSYEGAVARWWTVESPIIAVGSDTATLLASGKVLVAGGTSPTENTQLYDPLSGSWELAAPMVSPRYDHTVTLLADGKILVAGGRDGPDAMATAELYDPETGAWSATGSLAAARRDHTATLLPDGKVLAAGGSGLGGSLQSAEVYDPATGVWNTTGALLSKRVGHTATVLGDGTVLVVGGLGLGEGYQATAETYDPTSGGWSATGSLATARMDHKATLLADGRVLVTGGYYIDATIVHSLQSAELYDPLSGNWELAAPMASPRHDHTATILEDGKILVAGGKYHDGVGYTLVMSAEVYDPATACWVAAPSMTTAHAGHTATLLANGRVLVAGGADSATEGAAEVYLPASGGWSTTGSLAGPREGHTATLLVSGKILVAGGANHDGVAFHTLATAEVYDPQTGAWSATGSLAAERRSHTATLLSDGKVLVTGGSYWDGAYFDLASTEVYDPATETWNSAGFMPTLRRSYTATLLADGRVLVVGGVGGYSYLASAEVYNPETGAWSATGSLAAARRDHTATLLPDGKVLVAGGYGAGGSAHATAEVYDPGDGLWAPTGLMANARDSHTATLLADGRVLVAGGKSSGIAVLGCAELYDPRSGTWSPTGSLLQARWRHTATLLDSGRVLLLGGSSDGTTLLRTAELYDPGAGVWRRTPSSADVRLNHTATTTTNGKVLVTGGFSGTAPFLASCELYDPGVTVGVAWRPTVNAPLAVVGPGGSPSLSGSGFRGSWETSGGVSAGAAVDFPLVVMRGLGSGIVRRVAPSAFTDTALTFTVPAEQGYEQTLLRVITAGISSEPVVVTIQPGAPGRPAGLGGACSDGTGCLTGNCVDGVCCTTASCAACEGCAVEHHVGTCAWLPLGEDDAEPPDTCTGVDTCNGAGECLLKNAQACGTDGTLCASGVCTDGVCCGAPCGETCRSCDVAGHVGECFDVPAGENDNGCTNPGEACDGAGACKKDLGVGCSGGGECASTHCIDGVCCDTLCDTTCWSCGVPGAVGTCSYTPQFGIDAPACLGVYACDGAGTCKLANGQLASDGADCASGIVADGVCCDDACTGVCRSCDQSGSEGACRPYSLGGDPEGECGGDPGCEGSCDGFGACTYPANWKTCGTQTCTGSMLQLPDVCDGAGACVDGGEQACAAGTVCNASGTACLAGCSAQAECQSGYYCDLGTGSCKLKSVAGTVCSQSYECVDGTCADGYCCTTACTGACDVCNATPGACTLMGQGAPGSPSCAPYVCDGTGVDCPGSCADSSDCAANHYCSGTTCLARKALGVACGGGAECLSGLCADGFCCDGACTGRCRSCSLTGYEGQCRFHPQGEDPETECGAGDTCSGTCDGLGACVYPGSSRECAAQSCTGFTLTRAGSCDGAGSCDVPEPEACGNGFVCNAAGTGCESTCASSDDCQAGYYCAPANGTCRGQAVNGAACDRDGECASGFCVEGECCEAASCNGFACEGGTCRTSCVRDDQCETGWICEVLTGTCQAPAGTACDSHGDCQSGTCAGGYCCGEPCAGDDPTCGGSCDETGTCTYPHDGRACACDDGTSSVCTSGGCACEGDGADAGSGTGGDGGVVGEPGEGGGCSLTSVPETKTTGLLALVLLALASRRHR